MKEKQMEYIPRRELERFAMEILQKAETLRSLVNEAITLQQADNESENGDGKFEQLDGLVQ